MELLVKLGGISATEDEAWGGPPLWPGSGRCRLLLSPGAVTHQDLPLQPDQRKAPDSLAGSHISSLASCTLSPRVGGSVMSEGRARVCEQS